MLPLDLLGRTLDAEMVEQMKAAGVDACGENGEYRTLAIAGPVFRKPLRLSVGDVFCRGSYAFIDVYASKDADCCVSPANVSPVRR